MIHSPDPQFAVEPQERSTIKAAPDPKKERSRWHRVYYLLSAFEIMAVAMGLYLVHFTMSKYKEAVTVNESWLEIQSSVMELGRRAAAGNAPGKSDFEAGEFDRERTRLESRSQGFGRQADICRNAIRAGEPRLQVMLTQIDVATVAFAKMTKEARLQVNAMEAEEFRKAERHRSSMDDYYYGVNDAVSMLAAQSGTLQSAAFVAQRDRARVLRKVEYSLVFTILVMVVAVTYYRHRLVNRMRRGSIELMKVHTRLVESEKRAQLIIASAGDGVVAVNEDGTIIDWNPQAERTFGWSRHETLGRRLYELIFPSHLDDVHPLTRNIKQAVGNTVETSAVRKDGEPLTIGLRIAEIDTSDGVWYSAFLHDITERKRAEQELAVIHRQLVDASRQAGMAEIATGVLHNVGNVLNSVNVSANLVAETVRESRVPRLVRATHLMQENIDRIGEFLTLDEQGKHLPGYLLKLANSLCSEQKTAACELESLTRNIEHIKSIVSTQQVYAKVGGMAEPVGIQTLLDDALRIGADSFERHGIQIVREGDETLTATLDRQKLLQILVNLIRNAQHAICDHSGPSRKLFIRTNELSGERFSIEVIDTGVGIDPDNLTRIFSHGFTTKSDGHGFGLHASALAAREMGGSLTACSDGLGSGSCFTVELPTHAMELAHD